MKKTQKTKLTALFMVLLTLFTALFIPINAAETDTSENVGIEEIMPTSVNRCTGYYQNGKPYLPYGVTEDDVIYDGWGWNDSEAFMDHVIALGYSPNNWKYWMGHYTYGGVECKYHYWYNNMYPGVYFYHL